MCGRFYVDEDTAKEIQKIVAEVDKRLFRKEAGDIHPSEMATIITGKKSGLLAESMQWGFPSTQSTRLLINARSESALEKKIFSDSVLRRRCVIPAKHFYEWDQSKNKVTFTWEDSATLYMAGFYQQFDDGEKFIILTKSANDSMKPVHDRMPLILSKNQIKDWIFDESRVRSFLSKESPMLTRFMEYEQMSLFQFM